MARTLVISIIALIGLSGCFATTGPGLAIVGLATFIVTDKTATDHAVTLATGEDCSALEFSKGRDYCVADGDRAATEADTALYGPSGNYDGFGPYCYRTLGRVNCYNHPDPLASEQARVP